MRLIDADTLMKKAEKTLYADHPFIRFMRSQVNNAPTIDATPKWIPCEKELPNENEIFYNDIGIDDERKVSDRVLAIDSDGFIRTGYFMKACNSHEYYGKGIRNKYSRLGTADWAFGEHYMGDPNSWVCGSSLDIVAWMPLPRPYEGERKDSE